MTGQQGQKATFKVALSLTQGFGLEPDAAMQLMLTYNMRCVPPWSEGELRRMLESAAKLAPLKERGYLLRTRKQAVAKPAEPSFTPMAVTTELLQMTAAARPYGIDGLAFAAANGLLIFTTWQKQLCYGVTDSSKKMVELRRVDNKPFPAAGTLSERKSHALRGSIKRWPVGISAIGSRPLVLLTEGIPDFLAAHQLVSEEAAGERVAVVCMLSASPRIGDDALPYFATKTVRIVPHLDQAGIDGARKWRDQLVAAGATVEFFDLRSANKLPVKDLYDFERATLGRSIRSGVVS